MIWLPIAAVFVAYAVCNFLDNAISVVGIRSGVAVEGNTLLVKLAGTDKPPVTAYILYGSGEALLLSIPAIVGIALHRPPWGIVSCGPWIAMIARHIQGYESWRKLGVKLL